MYKELWNNKYKAVCLINFYTDNGIKITSLTGFKAMDKIITDEYIYKIQKCVDVIFQFVKEDGYTVSKTIKIPFNDFTDRINRLCEFANEGYAIIEMNGLDINDLPSLEIDFSDNFSIGDEIAVIGCHIDKENICLSSGLISSFFKAANGKRFVQFDAAIKQGNSGSPLINVKTGKVVGVVGYRLGAVTQTYEAFKHIIDENLKLLKNSEGMMNIKDIDPIQVLIANQNQLKQISKEYYRSATMSFGFAHEINTIQNYSDDANSSHKPQLIENQINS